jgi:mannose-6-phosphate isomerase-like protein (cupin superfamily)
MDDFDRDRPQAGFTWAHLLELQHSAGRPYVEFIRSASLSTGLYVLPAGAIDEQQPHAEDEVYVVIAGGSLFTAGEETREIRAGDVFFVAAGVPHRFHDISEELRVIVVFAPPEGSQAAAASSSAATTSSAAGSILGERSAPS